MFFEGEFGVGAGGSAPVLCISLLHQKKEEEKRARSV
jgi:hypothetical protein